jgi:SAM-dependent methyltransferase
MTNWSAGYVTEVTYTYGFHRELVPQYLALAALARGIAAPGLNTEPIRLLELGCGQGLSANLIAAANPHIDYTAIDFNPTHIAGARKLATAAGIPNVHFREASFEEIAADDSVGQFDMITLHGIYTWVSAENRAHIVKIARDKLKPGGLLYVSYNSYPGWTSVLPIRRLFTDTAAAYPGMPIFDRLDESLRLFDRLAEVGARYIRETPGLVERIKQLQTQQRNYVAHEYLNGEWTIFHFADVASDLSAAKLSYVASAHLLDHIDAINLTAEQSALLAEIKDPIRREGLRDLIVNQQFRRDIFARGAVPLTPHEARKAWLDLRFGLSTVRGDVPLKVQGRRGEANLHAEVYEPLLDAFARGPRTVRQLVEDPKVAALGWVRVQQALLILVGAGHLQPCLEVKGDVKRKERARAFNAAVIQRAQSSADLQFLASPVTGGGQRVDRISQLFLLCRERKQSDPVQFAWNLLSGQGERLIKNGQTLQTAEENLAEIRMFYDLFINKQLPILEQLGIA